MRFFKLICASLLSVLLFFISWPPNGYTPLIFISFVPLIWLVINFDSQIQKPTVWKLMLFFNTIFLLINLLLTSWVMKAHWAGGLFASFLNTFLMTLVFIVMYLINRYKGFKHACISLPIFWLAIEYLHLNWDFRWPWMNLGNIFSNQINWIQWYEYTGVLGGTLWVLVVNLCIYLLWESFQMKRNLSLPLIIIFTFMTIPIFFSYRLYPKEVLNPEDLLRIVIVQPNFEPHTEKFTISQRQQIKFVENLLMSIWDSNPHLILLPETFLTDWIWESRIENSSGIKEIRRWLKNHPQTQILTGASTGKVIYNTDNLPSSARKSKLGTWYEVFNTALLVSSNNDTQVYHKSKLVPGAEMIPFSFVLKPFLERFPIKIGGSIGNFGINDSLFNLQSIQGDFTSLICYESIFGEYVGRLTQKGAEWICIITNDGWWGDTYGHQQHLLYAKLRAIESRKTIVRSANTGISAIILPNGKISQQIPYGKSGILNSEILKSNVSTFYSIHGDYLGRLASFLAFIYLLQMIVNRIKNINNY